MKKNSNNLINAIIFFVLGVVLFSNPDAVVKVISYILGGILILVGIYKCVNYYIQDKRLGVVNRNEIAFGITAVVLGLIFIVLASAIEFLIRVVFGAWMILEGLSKIFNTFYTTDRTSKFYALIVVGIIFVAAGIYTIVSANLALQIIGLFMIIYSIIDFISYFVYKEEKNSTKEDKVVETELLTKEDVIEAEVVEDNKKKSNSKKKK